MFLFEIMKIRDPGLDWEDNIKMGLKEVEC
jgi:hypothetical protein